MSQEHEQAVRTLADIVRSLILFLMAEVDLTPETYAALNDYSNEAAAIMRQFRQTGERGEP